MDTAAGDEHVDLLHEASSSELLAMAARSLVRSGADAATAQRLCPEGLVLVGHVGFGAPFVDHFAIVQDSTPCSHAVDEGLVHVPDVATDPLLDGTVHQKVILEAGSRSCTSASVVADGRVVGVVSAHYRRPGPHDPAPVRRIVDQLARHLQHRPEGDGPDLPATAVIETMQLRRALETRNVIGMAKGILMATMGITDDEAFAVLTRASQRENVKLREICARIVARHRPDDPAPF